jgi:hypothetical protein
MVVYTDGWFVESSTGAAFLCADWVFFHDLLISHSICTAELYEKSRAALLLASSLLVWSGVLYSHVLLCHIPFPVTHHFHMLLLQQVCLSSPTNGWVMGSTVLHHTVCLIPKVNVFKFLFWSWCVIAIPHNVEFGIKIGICGR